MPDAGKRNIKYLPSLNRELDKWLKLKADLREFDSVDTQTILDTCEGETELYEMLCLMAEEAKEADAQALGIKSLADDLAARKKRLKARHDMIRAQIGQAMEIAGIDTITGPTCTLSVGRLGAPTIITDETKIPVKFWKKQDPVLDKTALNKALADGETVEGALLGNPGNTLSISFK